MKFIFTWSFIFLIQTASFPQRHYQQLLDTAFSDAGAVFISQKPIIQIQIKKSELFLYIDSYKIYSGRNASLDTIMFAQIIKNAANVDTSDWDDSQLSRFFLIKNSEEQVNKKAAIKKISKYDKKKISYYRKLVNKFNSTSIYNRDIYCFSKPVFDDSKSFAIIQWDNANSGLAGGGGIRLYQFKGNKWFEIGIISNWKY